MEGILAIIFIFGGGSLFLLAISPVGRAIAARIQGGGGGAADEAVRRLETTQQQMLDELESVRRDLTEVQERVDFTERMLAQHRQSGLPSGEGGAGPGSG